MQSKDTTTWGNIAIIHCIISTDSSNFCLWAGQPIYRYFSAKANPKAAKNLSMDTWTSGVNSAGNMMANSTSRQWDRSWEKKESNIEMLLLLLLPNYTEITTYIFISRKFYQNAIIHLYSAIPDLVIISAVKLSLSHVPILFYFLNIFRLT